MNIYNYQHLYYITFIYNILLFIVIIIVIVNLCYKLSIAPRNQTIVAGVYCCWFHCSVIIHLSDLSCILRLHSVQYIKVYCLTLITLMTTQSINQPNKNKQCKLYIINGKST